MATVTRENIGLLNEKIVVKVEKDDYLPSFQKAIKDYSKKANIPGFRKGMVPVGMVKKMYGSSVFADEVIKSVEKGLSDYMTNENLQIFAQPLPLPDNDSSKLDMNQPSEYQFAFEVGLKPEFTLTDLAAASLTRYKIEVTEETLNKEVTRLQESMAKKVEQETVNSEEDELTVKIIETDAEGNEIEGGINNTSSKKVSIFSPEFRTELMGKKKEDVLTTQLSKAFTDNKEAVLTELGLSTANPEEADKFVKIEITDISSMEKAELNEEFFKQVYPDSEITTEEAFREALKKDIEAQLENSSSNQLKDQIYHALLHTEITFPDDFLKRWMLTGTDKPKTPEEVEAEYPKFIDQLKWSLIMDKIVQENNIEVKPEDLREFAKAQLLSYMGGSNINIDQPWVNDYIDRMMKDKKFVEDSFQRIQVDKVLSWAETQVNPVESVVSEEEFTRTLESHNHEH